MDLRERKTRTISATNVMKICLPSISDGKREEDESCMQNGQRNRRKRRAGMMAESARNHRRDRRRLLLLLNCSGHLFVGPARILCPELNWIIFQDKVCVCV